MKFNAFLLGLLMSVPAASASADAWDYSSQPSHFGGDLAQQIGALPIAGHKPGLTGVTMAIVRAFSINVSEVESSLVAVTTDSGTTAYGFIDHISQKIEIVFEVDQSGWVIGGDYATEGRGQHPDFVWNPYGPGKSPKKVRRIPTARIQALLGALETDGQPVLCPDCVVD